jgi:hypothetical protein
VLSRFLRRLQRDPLRARVEQSIRRGTGLRKGEWLLTEMPADAARYNALASDVVEWCQREIGDTRRPYGIDQLALAVACAEPGGDSIASATFGIFRPVDFYREGGVAERVAEFIRCTGAEALLHRDDSVRFAAALFSWGDVARDTIFSDDEPAA